MPISDNIICPLCRESVNIPIKIRNRIYYKCENCRAVFLDETQHPSPEQEKARYLEHNNNVEDAGYRNFVEPVTSGVRRDFSRQDEGLDFGAGSGPVLSKVLMEQGYVIKQYDPFFHDFPDLLKAQYDYIACCEVVEHFRKPHQEFKLLKFLLKPGGKLYCMTNLYDTGTDFSSWYYANDISHIIFYCEDTMLWIKKNYNFSSMFIDKRLIVFKN